MFQAVGSIYINGTWENIIFPSNLCLTSMSTFANIGNTFRQWACDIEVGKKLLEINLIVQRQSASNDLSIFKDFFLHTSEFNIALFRWYQNLSWPVTKTEVSILHSSCWQSQQGRKFDKDQQRWGDVDNII